MSSDERAADWDGTDEDEEIMTPSGKSTGSLACRVRQMSIALKSHKRQKKDQKTRRIPAEEIQK